jgi:TonB family protein
MAPMNRLQKKCFFASAGFHLLLVLILLIGPAFLSSSSKQENVPELNFVPSKTLDDLVSNPGGSRGAEAPTPAPPTPPAPLPVVTQPTPVPVAEKPPAPEPPPKEKVKEVTPPKDNPASLVAVTKPKPKNQQINTNLVMRNPNAANDAKARATADAKAVADHNKRIAAAFNRAAANISGNLSGTTDIKLSGPGSGISYGNWLSAVKQRYTEAWIVPDGVTDDSATVTATVTIARDGEVLSTSILRFSGNAPVDQSVKATLDRVPSVPPLPDGAKEDKRTVTINFNVKAKQGLG